jgi:hypothetical protein
VPKLDVRCCRGIERGDVPDNKGLVAWSSAGWWIGP